MPPPPRCLLFALVCVGCQSMTPAPLTAVKTTPPSAPVETSQVARQPDCLGALTQPRSPLAQPHSPGRQFWEDGQKAMQAGQPEKAIPLYEQSLATEPKLVRSHLSLAAAHLEKGDSATACVHLASYLQAHPENGLMRVHHAELLWRLKKHREARTAFESALADNESDLPTSHQIHCHSRLMQLAEIEENEYAEHLHRGIGLLLLARERAALGENAGELTVESLLCRAAGELTLARLQRPDEARPCWYLYRAWSGLGQSQPAQRWLREANAQAPFSDLTPAEQRGLQLAGRDSADRVRR